MDCKDGIRNQQDLNEMSIPNIFGRSGGLREVIPNVNNSLPPINTIRTPSPRSLRRSINRRLRLEQRISPQDDKAQRQREETVSLCCVLLPRRGKFPEWKEASGGLSPIGGAMQIFVKTRELLRKKINLIWVVGS